MLLPQGGAQNRFKGISWPRERIGFGRIAYYQTRRRQNAKMPQKRHFAHVRATEQLGIADLRMLQEDAHDCFAAWARICAKRRQQHIDPVVRQSLMRKKAAKRLLDRDGNWQRTVGLGSVVHVTPQADDAYEASSVQSAQVYTRRGNWEPCLRRNFRHALCAIGIGYESHQF